MAWHGCPCMGKRTQIWARAMRRLGKKGSCLQEQMRSEGQMKRANRKRSSVHVGELSPSVKNYSQSGGRIQHAESVRSQNSICAVSGVSGPSRDGLRYGRLPGLSLLPLLPGLSARGPAEASMRKRAVFSFKPSVIHVWIDQAIWHR